MLFKLLLGGSFGCFFLSFFDSLGLCLGLRCKLSLLFGQESFLFGFLLGQESSLLGLLFGLSLEFSLLLSGLDVGEGDGSGLLIKFLFVNLRDLLQRFDGSRLGDNCWGLCSSFYWC